MPGAINMGVCPITLNASGAVVPLRFVTALGAQTGVGANAIGVAAQPAANAEPFTADVLGVVSVEVGAAVTAGGLAQSDASGRAIDRVAGAILGRFLDGATAAGQLARLALIPN